ncbi:MAG: AAA family ATPase [Pseudomonadales bacterium]|nr:AAA family ATPase [Pseudomonadales bacterium]NRA15753.1 AAA family ATPase [Oceanospirillaceae bacterium]
MTNLLPLTIDQLYKNCELDLLPFKNTSTLEKFSGFFGQSRALEAMSFGVGMRRPGYNFFVMGNPHTGRFSFAMDMLKTVAKKERKPSDWVYINNFEEGRSPLAIHLTAGKAVKLKRDNQALLEAVATELPAAYESPNFQRKKSKIEKDFNTLYEQAIDRVEQQAREHSIALFRDGGTIGFTPISDGQAMDEAQFSQLDEEIRQNFNQNISALEDFLGESLTSLPVWRREAAEKLKRLETDTAVQAVEPLLEKIKFTYSDRPKLIEYYKDMLKHLADNAEDFLHDEKSAELLTDTSRRAMLQEWYGINLLVDNSKTKGAPVIYEAHPTYENLFGRVEYVTDLAALATSYQRIRAGALHKANGGYLLLDAEKLLEMPHVYAALKRALKAHELRIEHPSADTASASSISQSPLPVNLKVKVALVGSRHTYYVLQGFDPDFEKTFRVVVDFDEAVPRTDKSIRNYARLIKTLADQEGLAPFSRSAIARLVEHSSRSADDTALLSSHIGNIVDLLCEADFKRIQTNDELVTNQHVDLALEAQEARTGRLSERIYESILNNVVLIDSAGEQVGKCNGLTVLQVGDVCFGTPARITATVFPGDQGILDIEREADLGQSIHSKGVLILSGYLGYKYAKGFPIKISANIAMEQSYGAIDGDSASLAEVCALISSLTKIAISQTFAITGSINQYGEVQAIGGVNEKIEGFFEICKRRQFIGGPQGVIVPRANIRNMMLKKEVLNAVNAGQFYIYAVDSVDECLALLMNRDVGNLDADDNFTKGSVNAMAVSCFEKMSKIKT